MDLRVVHVGTRSTLHVRESDGATFREYHDTGVMHGPNAPLPRRASLYRGAGRESLPPPPHLRDAWMRLLTHRPTDIREFARRCGVKTSTAWCYLTKVVETWPETHTLAQAVVFPPLLALLSQTRDRSGSLRALLERLLPDLDDEWRCVENRYAHLRLARVCLDARGT